MKITIKTRWSGNTIYEYETEGNTLRLTVEKAVEDGLSLPYADLMSANLQGADLRGADLREAILQGANLNAANLRGADLRYANLENSQ